ncbi:MAG TPA: NADH-quinone oxidoreductase subunit L [Chloroflexota bacterium]|nr:NADH-quinone oxidoreductase subunit L [Chloroflexota bacterium]
MELAWLVPALPLAAFAVIGLLTLRYANLSSFINILAIGGSCAIAWMLFFRVLGGEPPFEQEIPWLALNLQTALTFGLRVDPLSAIMIALVTTVSLVIQVYSRGYLYEPAEEGEEHGERHGPATMVRDSGFARYFAFMALFTAAMLGLVLANNLLTIYIFWEGVGLGSYLLIGFWYRKPEAAAAAKKAFVTTRFGDFGFLIGILYLYMQTGTLQFARLAEMAEQGQIGSTVLTVGALLIFCGAVGKSAQFPLHVWLPDAMEGPTPVSALIHAATMVAAGVYLVARALPIFEHAPAAMLVVALIGGFTAIFAASMGLVAYDIKRVLAFSTISQLGYMMLGLGAGAIGAGMFHLFTHAFFKALLFLCAGSVIFMLHRAGAHDPVDRDPLDPPRAQDIRYMGGMWRRAPISAITMTIGALSLAGIPPLAGFWSKDDVLLATYERASQGGGIYWLLLAFALATVLMTAFYMFRVIFMTFAGEHRGPADAQHIRESPAVMTVPLMLLALPSIAAGLWGAPQLGNGFGHFLEGGRFHSSEMSVGLAGLSTLLGAVGIGLAWAMYYRRSLSPETMAARFRPIYLTLYRKYWIDELYMWLIDKFVVAVSFGINWFDQNVIDGIVNGLANAVGAIGNAIRQVQTGRIPAYALAVFLGLTVIALYAIVLHRALG